MADGVLDLWAPKKLGFFYSTLWARYRVAYGGRGGMKSWTIAQALVIRAAQGRLRILCCREFQRSIADSVHQLLADTIDRLGLSSIYQVEKTAIYCLTTGSKFIFAGLKHNVSAIKSLEGIDICWVEEAETVSENSWAVLTPTIRKSNSEIWISFNPVLRSDPTYQRFVVNPPPGAIVVKVGWRDNPRLPDVLKAEAEHMRRTDPDGYMHIWEGECWTRADAQIFAGKWAIDDFVPVRGSKVAAENWNGPYYGADWGFAMDPTVLLRCWIFGKMLYVDYAESATQIPIVDLPRRIFDKVPESRRYKILADESRPETINHMVGAGFHCEGAYKWPNSVEDGIEFLRGFDKIVIHPRCKGMAAEARLYSYKVDAKTREVLPDIVDKNNHHWDALRYALQPMIRRRPEARRGATYSPGAFRG